MAEAKQKENQLPDDHRRGVILSPNACERKIKQIAKDCSGLFVGMTKDEEILILGPSGRPSGWVTELVTNLGLPISKEEQTYSPNTVEELLP